MLILGIETSTGQVGCAVAGHEGVLASAHSCRARRHAETLTPMIDFVRRQARIELDEIGAVAVGLGPGLYTGLRVGIAAAKAIALALRVPVVGVPSLDLLAFPARFSHRLIVATMDARRGELFYAFYRQVPGGVQRVSEEMVGKPADLVSELVASGEECLLVGDGALRYADELREVQRVEIAEQGLAFPSATALVLLAHARAMREEFVPATEVFPIYLRKPDAEINWVQREGT
ncbi:MAG: tRNA (adenosine(37)-N6)-threonylcarbamoyltransferase complex dimerization subunit type 1 TsaB [Actinomycetota bacterium]|nr:tRNA (adenosine(37)-N6)-threonylcarbamoyltransferase complex dimerization subunit type 1 TsaB [Actinomycetota bacterium]